MGSSSIWNGTLSGFSIPEEDASRSLRGSRSSPRDRELRDGSGAPSRTMERTPGTNGRHP